MESCGRGIHRRGDPEPRDRARRRSDGMDGADAPGERDCRHQPAQRHRGAAIVQTAIFDAVNGIEKRYTPIHVAPGAAAGASARAAAMQAAYATLVALFPTQKAAFDARKAVSMTEITERDGSAAFRAAWRGARRWPMPSYHRYHAGRHRRESVDDPGRGLGSVVRDARASGVSLRPLLRQRRRGGRARRPVRRPDTVHRRERHDAWRHARRSAASRRRSKR